MSTDFVRHLKKLPLIRGLPDDVIREMAQQVTPHHLQKDTVLIRKGGTGNSVYIIQTGWVKISTVDADGEELVLNHCGPGEVVGEMALIDDEPRSAWVTTLSPVKALELKRDVFMNVLQQQPILALDVMRNFSARLRFSTAYIEKAIEWSYRIAEGDYSFAMDQIKTAQSTIVDTSKADDVRAAELLTAFFRMVEGIREREESLKKQVQQLTIEIDETKRRQTFEEVAQSDFFVELKSTVKKMRQQQEAGDE